MHELLIRQYRAIVYVNIFNPSREFTPNGKELMTVTDLAIADHNILCWCFQPPAFGISTGLQGNSIIPLVKYTIFNQYILTHFWVNSIIVMPMGVDVDATDKRIFR
ncbi:hypothetical protein D3C73_1322720 [compost metagenome]